MNLKHITDTSLRSDSRRAALKEKEATTLLLHHIKEVDRRRLYSEWKFTSLFDWCVRELGLCEGSAHLRITAARLLEDIPELEEKIEQGSLNLSNISQVNQFCRENDIKDNEKKKGLLKEVENLSKKQAEAKLLGISGKSKPARESRRKVSSTISKVSILLSDETVQTMDEVRSLLGKNVSSDELIKLMAQSLKEKIEKDRFKQVEKPRATKGTKKGTRVISAEVKRQVYLRDRNCVNCGSKHDLNFDHRIPYSLGGDGSLGNIRLLCFNCNQRAWIASSGPPLG